ncbi:MAG TPA: DUF4153 domain-containing protein [Gemmatimonadales bacterium]
MRFPSLDLLARNAVAVLRRFPWTLAVGALAAFAAIVGSLSGTDHAWQRLAFVAALGLPLTIGLTLLGEAHGWRSGLRHLVLLAGVLALAGFFLSWPGMERRHDGIRYLQLSAALHLSVAFLPFLAAGEETAFWQYNRRLFLGFLRAGVFSAVLYAGVVIALAALDKLFGVDVPEEAYLRIWFVMAFVMNTWIFLAAVPEHLAELAQDRDYPRALKIFAQYILTPLAFTYLLILLAYLVKIVAGAEWPSGWIGWLVASVSVTGLLGFLLVHPLRADPGEGWIRTYARWLFVGLIPAALMLLVAFWKRILPYGLTELRLLGLVLGLWLLGIAVLYTIRRGASIRVIPVTLAAVLLLTLYGPLSLTHGSIDSQAHRLARMLHPPAGRAANAREASAALRFLIDHNASEEIAAAVGRDLPPVDWAAIPRYGTQRDSIAKVVMQLAGADYIPEYADRPGGWFYVNSNVPIRVEGYAWAIWMSYGDGAVRQVNGDSVSVVPVAGSGLARVRVGRDTLVFDLRPLARRYADSVLSPIGVTAERLLVEDSTGRRGALSLSQLNGQREADSVRVASWTGTLLLRP